MKINKLTPEQEALLPQIRDEWLAHGLSTEPADRAAAEDGVRAAYAAAGLAPPRFMIWLSSPWAGAIGQAIAPEIVAAALCRAKYGQVYGQVGDQVGDQVYGQVGDQVDGQVGGQVYDQVHGQVYDQVHGQVYDQVHGQVYDQVRGQVHGQVGDQVGDQVDDQVDDQVRGQVGGQVRGQVGGQVRGQVYGQVGDQVDDQVDDQVRGQVHGQVGDQQYKERLSNWWRGRMWGQHNAGYYAWLDAMERIGVTGLEPIHGQQQVARNAGWWWCHADFAILTERPQELHRDQLGRLHCETGPAISYPDGWGFHAWHGRRVPASLIEGDGWTVQQILAERNQEIRRCAIERIGWWEFTKRARLVCIAHAPDPGNDGQEIGLFELPGDMELFDEPVRILIVTNGSVERDGTRRRFGLTCPAHFTDPVAAAAWTYGWTTDQYRALEARR